MFLTSMVNSDAVCLQLDCATSVASEFYFRSHLGRLLDAESGNSNVTSLSPTPAVSKVDSVSTELEQAVSVDLTLIVLWQVMALDAR